MLKVYLHIAKLKLRKNVMRVYYWISPLLYERRYGKSNPVGIFTSKVRRKLFKTNY